MSLFAMNHWTWVIAGLIMLAVELLVPAAFFLWLGVSALVTALFVFLIPDMSWQLQLLVFSVLSVVSVILSKKYLVRKQNSSEVPNLNQRAQQYVGRTVMLSEPIKHGRGKVIVDDSQWQVTGPNLAKGTAVKIISTNGSVFEVEEMV